MKWPAALSLVPHGTHALLALGLLLSACTGGRATGDGSTGELGQSPGGGFVLQVLTARDAGPSDAENPAPCGEMGLPYASAVAYSPDGTLLAVAGPRLRMLSTSDWHEVRRLQAPPFPSERLKQLSFVANGTVLAGAVLGTDSDQALGFWRAEDGAFLYGLGYQQPPARSRWHQVGFSQTPLLALTDGESAALWNEEERAVARWLRPTSGTITSLALADKADVLALVEADNPAGDASLAMASTRLSLWDVRQGRLLRTISTEDGQVAALALSPDSSTLAAVVPAAHCQTRCETTLDFYRVADGQRLRRSAAWEAGLETLPTGLKFLPGGDRVAVAHSASSPPYTRLQIIRTSDAALINIIPSVRSDLVFSPDGKLAIPDDSIEIRNVSDGTVVDRVPASTGNRAPTFSPDGRFLASVDGQDVVLWQMDQGVEARRFPGLGQNVQSLAFSPDGRTLASGGSDGVVRLWHIDQSHEPLVMGQGQPLTSLVFSPDGETLAIGDTQGTIALRQTETGALVNTWHRQASVSTLAFSPDGRLLLSGGTSPALNLWNGQTGEPLASASHGAGVVAMAFSPDGVRLASAASKFECGGPCLVDDGDAAIRIWRVSDSALLLESEIPTLGGQGNAHTGVWALAFAPDGRTLLTAGPQNAGHMYQVPEGNMLATFGSVSAGIPFAVSPDATRVVLGASPIEIWCTGR